MSGVRLDTRVHIITGASTAVQNVQKCIELCGLKSDQIMLQPLASGQAVLTEDEKTSAYASSTLVAERPILPFI